MEQKKNIVYLILCMVPIFFGLFFLALMNVLFMFLGVIVILMILAILKKRKPTIFDMLKKKPKPAPEPKPAPKPTKEPRVYMVLVGMEEFGVRRIKVNKSPFSIGRSFENDYKLEGDTVSRQHLKIEYSVDEEVCFAIDMDSSRGTYLNSKNMESGERYRLIQGDRIMIADRVFTVEYAHF